MPDGNPSKSAAVGSWVKVRELDSGDEETFHIVDARQVDYLENRIPPDNPMGRALLGRKAGDEVAVAGPERKIRYSILAVGQ